jgi:uridine monophosphate synthetase
MIKQKLIESNCIKYGEYVLKSGEISNIYVDLRQMINDPQLLRLVSSEMYGLIDHNENTVIAGIPMGGIPIASTISVLYDIPQLMLRKTAKDHGLKKLIEGDYVNKSCTLVEDVINSGSSIIEYINTIKDDIEINKIIVVLDREAGGVDRLREMGYEVHALFKLSELLEDNQINNQIYYKNPVVNKFMDIYHSKMTKLIVSLDLVDPHKILLMIELLHPYILGIKLHVDTIVFDNMSYNAFINKIVDYKKRFGLYVIEDRKLADIGYTNSRVVNNIKKFADAITIHSVSGISAIQSVDNSDIGIILIQKLSCANNLIDYSYTFKTIEMGKQLNNLIGYVGQNKIDNNSFLFTPGVALSSGDDGNDQRYNTPRRALEKGTNVFIVGRAIYNADDPISVAKQFSLI